MRDQSSSQGFALPMAILVVALLTISATAAFVIASSEERETANSRDQVDAFTLAQSGLERFLLSRSSFGLTSTPPAAFEFARIDLPGGYADVTLERVRPSVAGSPVLYVIRSLGVRTDPSLPGTPFAEHTVAMFARWQAGSLSVRAAFTSLTGFHKPGASGTITGINQCGAGPNVAGVSVPTPPGYTQSGGGTPVPTGTPPIENMGGYQQAANETFINWQGIVNGTALTPDVTIPPQSFPSATAFANPAYWPVIMVDNVNRPPFTLPRNGQGTLIVTGQREPAALHATPQRPRHPYRYGKPHHEREQELERDHSRGWHLDRKREQRYLRSRRDGAQHQARPQRRRDRRDDWDEFRRQRYEADLLQLLQHRDGSLELRRAGDVPQYVVQQLGVVLNGQP